MPFARNRRMLSFNGAKITQTTTKNIAILYEIHAVLSIIWVNSRLHKWHQLGVRIIHYTMNV